MSRLCKVIIGAFLAAYILALAAFLSGTIGWFGVARDPLSGVFLIPLGLPWNLLVERFPEPVWPWLAAAAPAINLILLRLVCGHAHRRA